MRALILNLSISLETRFALQTQGQMPMTTYELLYIVSSHFTDEEVEEVAKGVNAMLEKAGGKVLKDQTLGKIRLAYPIGDVNHGTFRLVFVAMEKDAINKLDNELKLKDELVRHQILVAEQGAIEREYVIESYEPPLSPEGRRADRKRDTQERKPAPRPTPPAAELPSPKPADAAEAKMSIEELDKKLDEILDEDLSKDV